MNAFSQRGIQGIKDKLSGFSTIRSGSGAKGGDSLKRRDKNEDSITIRFRYLDSTRNYLLDSSVTDFTRRFPIPATNIYLGNTGTASKSILFSPILKPGWDPGFHAFDVYKWSLEKVRFFSTTRPYSELNYQLASKAEQLIEVLHTQNVKPNWNFLFQYRLINAPGSFQNQKTNHNNYLVTSRFQSVNQRYNNYFVLLGNKLQSGENGGIKDNYINDPDFNDRFIIPTKLGGAASSTRNFFSTDVGTGNRYNEFTVLLRQQYDFGRKDSLVTDSTVIPLFYPRLRFEHTFQYGKYQYEYRDYLGDSAYYHDNYAITLLPPGDTVFRKDQWKEITNDFSIYQFPDAKNLHQFIKLGAALQNLSQLLPVKKTYYNVYGHAEYRNKTRNQKWDLEANGKLYFVGLNAGDYNAYASLQRSTGKKVPGYVQFGFENVNRTPSFIYNTNSDFYQGQPALTNFKKENTTHLSASLYQPSLKLRLSGHYYLMTNYTYVTHYYQLEQDNSLFNVLLISLEKTIKVGKHWNWHADIYFQQVVGNAPVNLPLIYTRNRFAYEGNLGFKNLDIALGIEARYNTPYKADGYSPVLGQFFYQEDTRLDNPLPDITAYVHFRIRPFKAYFRVENLNTARSNGGFGFTNNNFAVPGYPYPGLILRLGVYWSFVN
ncbi:MAG: putative porin [Bacteroidota bacterium]|nr:putative porin [Bacteroidota bacterium]